MEKNNTSLPQISGFKGWKKNNSNVILEESEKIKIDLVNFFHGKNESSVDVLRRCLFYVLLKPNLFKKPSMSQNFY